MVSKLFNNLARRTKKRTIPIAKKAPRVLTNATFAASTPVELSKQYGEESNILKHFYYNIQPYFPINKYIYKNYWLNWF